MQKNDGGNGLQAGLIDLDQPAEVARRGRWSVRHGWFSNSRMLAAMACAIALLAAAAGAGASYAWTASHSDKPASKPVNRVLAFAEVPAEPTVSADAGSATGFTGNISIVNAEPRTIRIISLQAHESGLRLSSLPLPSSDRHYDIPPNGAVSIAVSLNMQCSSETPLSDISLKLDAYALEGEDVLGVPQSASLNILPWHDTIETIKLACSMK